MASVSPGLACPLPSPRLSAWRGLGGVLVLSLLFSGCGKNMSAGDCERVGKHMREVWDDEAATAVGGAAKDKSERAKNAIRSEGDKMEADWLSQCRRELEGRPVDQKEVDCIMAAKTVAEVQRCATPTKR